MGTGLRKTINSLISPTKSGTAALKKYGMSMDDFRTKSGALKPLPKIMETINKHTDKLSKADKGAFFKAVFGTTGQQAAETLAQSSKALDGLVKKEREAEKTNYVQNLAQKNMASTQMQFKRLKTNLDAIAIDIGSSLLPAINKAIGAFSTWLQPGHEGARVLKDVKGGVKDLGDAVGNSSGTVLNYFGGLAEGLISVIKFDAKVISFFGHLVGGIVNLFHASKHSDGISVSLGKIAGAIIGIVGTLKY